MAVLLLRLLLPLLLGALPAHGARILAVLPIAAPSHLITFTSLTRALAERGHDVTLVCAYPQQRNHPRQRVLAIGERMTSMDVFNASLWLQDGTADNFWNKIKDMHEFGPLGYEVVTYALEHPDMQEILKQPAGTYDAIIAEVFFAQEVFVGLGHKFKAPVIAIHSHGDIADLNYVVGASTMPSFKPFPYLDVPDEMTIWERVENTFFTLYHLYRKWFHEYPMQQQLLDRYFPGSPPLLDLLYNVSLTVLNSHPSLCYAAPTPPSVVFAGGMHINPKAQPLPDDLQDFLDTAKEGVVYFSMGTLLQASDMTQQQKDMFMGAFGALKQRVLVKWNSEPPANLPANVRLAKWLPQDDILAHPNTVVFITHGGLLGTQEAVYHGVPVIGIPRFADQKFNVKLARRKGYGLELNFHALSKEIIESTIREIIENPKYAKAAQQLSQLFREQPVRPVDAAVFWVEHVMKHGGDHLRPASVRLAWHQYFMLDIFVLFVVVPATALVVLARWQFARVRRKASPTSGKSKKTQ